MQNFKFKEEYDRKKLEKCFKDQMTMLAELHMLQKKEIVYDIQSQ